MSSKKILWCCLALISVHLKLLSQGNKSPLTLKKAVETAIENNLNVQVRGLQQETAKVGVTQAKANMLPDLIGTVIHGINQGRNISRSTNTFVNQRTDFADYNLNSSVTLFNGFNLLNTLKQNNLLHDATTKELQQERELIMLQVMLAYLQILTNKELVNQSNKQIAVSQSQVDRLEILNREGAIAPSLLYDLRGQLANDQLTMIDNQNSLNVARLTIAQLMNVPYDAALEVEPISAEDLLTGYPSEVEAIFQAAVEQLSLVKAVELRRQGAAVGVKAARGTYFPTLFFSANLNTNYASNFTRDIVTGTIDQQTSNYVVVNGSQANVFSPTQQFYEEKINYGDQFKNNYGTALSIGLRIPIVNAFQARNRVALAKIQLKNATYVSKTTMIQLRQGVEQAYFNMKAAESRYKALLEQVDAFTQSFNAAEVRFNAGVGTSVDYLVARNNVDRANINLVSTKYDYILRMKVLDYYQAKPLW